VRARLAAAVLAGGFVLAGLSGCNSDTPAPPPASSTTDPPTSTTQKSEIADPLNLATFATNTCVGLTDAQVAPYMGVVSVKNQKQVSNGIVCSLLPQDVSKPALGIALTNIAAPTQELLYESQQLFPYRQKINPIAGYPTVDSSPDANGQDDCVTNIAVNATQSVDVHFSETNPSGEYYAKPCVASEALAALLIQNLKSGGA
jgi:hypothetical protein